MGVTIGFIGEDPNDNLQDLTEQKKQEVVEKARKILIKIPESRKAEVLKGFDCVVVNSFNDDYHCTDSEREERNRFAKDAKKIKSMKRIYRKLDEYVVAVREHLKFLDKVAEGNGMYDPDEFKKMFFKGKIDIVGMRFPKYKGPNRKDINYKYLSEFILSNADPSEIIPKWQRADYEDEDPNKLIDQLFTKEELDFVFSPLTKEESKYIYEIFDEKEDDQDGTNVGVTLSSKKTKKIAKLQPELMTKLKEMKREKNTYNRLNDAFLHNSIAEDLSEISKYDSNYQYVSKSDIPEFTGDIMNSKDYHKYMEKLQEFENENIYMDYHGKNKSLGEIKELQFKEVLEQDGWNIRNFAENKLQEEKLKRIQKREKKKEKELKKHLMDIENRRKARLDGSEYKDYKKKDKKKKKKKKNGLNEAKKNVKNTITEALIGKSSSTETSFKAYEEASLDLTGLFSEGDD